ncbi:hypothetical protein [Vibrio sp.]|uniref:hypothetical protein n=1 Tax=Vibrio sp. TaxID=678 RepID=UPI003D0FE38C
MADKPIRQFGRIVSPPDPRDFNLKWFIPKEIEPAPKARRWDFPADSLDQGTTPHCVGFAMADFGINLPTFTEYTNKDGHDFYYKCKIVDGDPEGENGTTIRSAAKVLQEIGAIDNYAFAPDVESIKWWLRNKGPLIVGTIWTEEMMEPDENLIVTTGGYTLGGHGYILNEITEDDYLGGQNSWGPEFGDNGRFYIHADDFSELMFNYGEALAAVELENYRRPKENCWLVAFFKTLWEKILKLFS